MTNSEMIAEFRAAFAVKSDRLRDWSLVEEEFEELADEAKAGADELKELADLVYVCYQFAASSGYDLDEAIRRVHASNMSKRAPDGTIERRADGKILKGKFYHPPDLSDLSYRGIIRRTAN